MDLNSEFCGLCVIKETKKCEHGKQKANCKDCKGSGICEHGIQKYYCHDCKGGGICIHDKYKRYCKECGGNSFCEHDKLKRNCIICSKSSFCIHDKLKTACRECKGSTFCIHDKYKRMCLECSGSAYCVHNKIKNICIECKGSAICEHNKRKDICKDCKGSSICIHNRNKRTCKECEGSALCEHGIQKLTCKDCKGSAICIHNKIKYNCKECKGSSYCSHDKQKRRCKICNGSELCKSKWCETRATKKYDGYCVYCFINLFPDKEISRNYKTKEKDVVERIKLKYPNFSWIHDKIIQDGCSLKRPDLLLDMGSHIIIIEIDENSHTDYDNSCENKRIMTLSQDVGHRPIVFIRFNPDDYINEDGLKIKSCWKNNKANGLISLDKNKLIEWNERINILLDKIKYYIDNPTNKTIELMHLFYDSKN